MHRYFLISSLGILISMSGSAQNIGINIDTPIFDLDLRGTDDTNDGGELQLATPSQTNFIRFFGGRLGDRHPFIAFHDLDTFHIVTTLPDWSTYTRRMTWLPSGKIGINFDAPVAELDIRPSMPESGAFYNLGNVDNTHFLRLYSGSTTYPGPALYWKNGTPLRIGSDENSFTERMRILSEGNIGIGTMTPTNRLDVRDDSSGDEATVVLALISTVTKRPVLQFSEWEPATLNSGMAIEYNGVSGTDNKMHILGVGGTRRMTFTTGGRMGIATENPNEYLEIGDSGRMFIGDGGGASRKGLLIDAVEPGNYVRLHPFNYSNSTDMDLFLPSRVNIGLAAGANGYKLCVDGKIIAEELRVQMSGGWPDYVFDAHYPLSSLEEIEQYIQSHRHLPNLPSADEVMEEGLLVGDMQARLLEKIEELTLHIIRQEKELKSLRSEVDLLKNK